MAPTWIYGVILVVVGSIGNNLGNNLVSLGHRQTHDKTITKGGDLSMNTEYSENPNSVRTDEKEGLCSWCNIGRVVFVVGNLFTFVSFAFGAQSLIASLESIQFVSNVFFVWYVHNEPVTRRMVLATLSIVVGNILVVIFAEHHAKKFTSDDMIYLYKTNYIYHGYLGIAFCVWLITTCIYNNYHHSRMNKRELLWNHSFIEPFMYAMSSAIIGTQAVLNSKCLALLLDSTFSGAKAEFSFWYVYFMLGSWLLLVAYWLTRLDGGLALFPPCFIIPVMQVFFVFFAILCGGIYFQEFVHFTLGQYFGFCSGVMLILAGVYGLAPVDMELHVPGDPKGGHVRIGHCAAATAVVHCEMVESNEGDIENGELDKKIDDTVQIKPQPAPLPEIDLYAVQPNEEDGPVPQMDLSSASARSTNGASKKNRRVVKRPGSAERAALPPLQVRGAAAESPLLHGDSTITPATAAGDQTPFTPAPFDHHHHQPEAELPAR